MNSGAAAKVMSQVVTMPTPPSQPNSEKPLKLAAASPKYAAEAVTEAASVPEKARRAACQMPSSIDSPAGRAR